MATEHEIVGLSGGYRGLASRTASPGHARRELFRLSHTLAAAAQEELNGSAPEEEILCVVVLRGGVLMYPGFGHTFAAADFCLLGMSRQEDNSVVCSYMTPPNRRAYAAAVLIDCVAATGGTLLAARRVLTDSHRISTHLAAVVCSSHHGTHRLLTEGIDVLGFSLNEGLDGHVVTPDLGELDAGDLFSGLPVDSLAQ